MNYLGYTNTKFFYYYYLLEKPPLQTPVTREAPAQAVLKAVHRPRFSAETPASARSLAPGRDHPGYRVGLGRLLPAARSPGGPRLGPPLSLSLRAHPPTCKMRELVQGRPLDSHLAQSYVTKYYLLSGRKKTPDLCLQEKDASKPSPPYAAVCAPSAHSAREPVT